MILITYKPTRHHWSGCHWHGEDHVTDSELSFLDVETRGEAVEAAARSEFADGQHRDSTEYWLVRAPTPTEAEWIARDEFEDETWDNRTLYQSGDVIREALQDSEDFRAAVDALRDADAVAQKAKAAAAAEVARKKQADADAAKLKAQEASERALLAELSAKYGKG